MDLRSYNPELYDFLVQNYGGEKNVSLVVDQTTGKTAYLAQNGRNNWGLAPTDLSSVDTVINPIPGMGSDNSHSAPGANSYMSYINYVQEGHVPDYMIVGSGYMWDDSDNRNGNMLMNTIEFAKNNGANIQDVGIVPFSWSGRTAMMNAGKVFMAYPDMNVKVATLDVSLMDGFLQYVNKHGQGGAYADEVSALLANQDKLELTMLIPDGQHWGDVSYAYDKESREVTQLQEKGFDAVMVLSADNNHKNIREIAIKGGNIFDYAAGKISLEEFLASADEFYVTDDSALDLREISYTRRGIDSSSTFFDLSKINDNVMLQGEKIGSNYEYAAQAMNAIRSKLKANNYGSRSVQVFPDSSGIPGCIAGYINAYYNMIASLMNDIEAETNKIITMAQKYVDLDNGMTRDSYDFLFTPIEETTSTDPSSQVSVSTDASQQASVQVVTEPSVQGGIDSSSAASAGATTQPISQSTTSQEPVKVVPSYAPSYSGGGYAPVEESPVSTDTSTDISNIDIIIENDDNSRIFFDKSDANNPMIVYEIPISSTDIASDLVHKYEDIYKEQLFYNKILVEDNKIRIMFDAKYFSGMSNEKIADIIMNGGKNNDSLI